MLGCLNLHGTPSRARLSGQRALWGLHEGAVLVWGKVGPYMCVEGGPAC